MEYDTIYDDNNISNFTGDDINDYDNDFVFVIKDIIEGEGEKKYHNINNNYDIIKIYNTINRFMSTPLEKPIYKLNIKSSDKILQFLNKNEYY